MSKKISVIIPVYNVEKYLRRCVESVLNQTYKNLEIILVDDGSPDGCPSICDDYSKKDSRVRTIHKTNGGLASARNAGLDSNPSGEYITFVDSDDWLSLDTYEYCLSILEKTNADVVQFDYTYVSDKKVQKQNPQEVLKEYSGKEILQHYMVMSTKTGSYSVCRCLFPKSAIGNIRFRTGRNNEDVDFKYKVLTNCSKLVDSNQVKYFYYQSGNSISTGKTRLKHIDDAYEAAEKLVELTKDEDFGDIRFLGEVKKMRTPFSFLCRIALFGMSDEIKDKDALIRELTKEHRKNFKILLKAPIPSSRKVLALLLAIDYHLVSIPISILKKTHLISGVI